MARIAIPGGHPSPSHEPIIQSIQRQPRSPKHIGSIRELDESNAEVLTTLVHTANKLAKEKGIHDAGFRLNINAGPNGGQTVYHLHVHLIGGRFMTWPPG